MKAVILAGGFGTRISEETHTRPKPMIEIGGKPILWHILKIYSAYNINDFIICCGYKGYVIKEYFKNYFLHMSDITFDISNNNMIVHQVSAEPWKVTLVDTGMSTFTGGRLKRVQDYIGRERFCFTYGDGVGNVNIRELIACHKKAKALVTLTAVQPPGRYGALELDGQRVVGFKEKPQGDGGWINGGFFVVEPEAVDLIIGDSSSWEQETLVKVVEQNGLNAYLHHGFWHPMDTLRDMRYLNALWETGTAPWKIWGDSNERNKSVELLFPPD